MNLEKIKPIPRHYSAIIQDVFNLRTLKNENYSLRALARDLDLTPGYLSEILSLKANLSLKRGRDVASKLGLGPEDQKLFLKLVEIAGASEANKESLEGQLYNFDSSHVSISPQLYSSISQWHSLALLELIDLKDFRFDLRWISEKLSISIEEASESMNNLIKSQLITIEADKIIKNYDYFVLPNGNNQRSAKDFHQDVLKKASVALEEQKSEERNFTAAFLHVKKDDIPLMSEKIKKFRRELAKEFESDSQADSVYMFSIQLYRVDR